MKFFKRIWTEIKFFLVGKKDKSDEKVYKEAKKTIEKGIDIDGILTNASNANSDEERTEILQPLIEFESAKQIVELIEKEPEVLIKKKPIKKRKKLYNLHELVNEIKALQSNLSLLDLKKSKITEVVNPDTSSIESRVNGLISLLNRNKRGNQVELSTFSVSSIDNDFKQLEKLLEENSTLKKHRNREEERIRYVSNINQELNKLNSLIGQNKLEEAKLLIVQLSKSIKPDYRKGIRRLDNAKELFKNKEIEILERQKAELLNRQEEALRKIIESQELKRNLEVIEKKNWIENNTHYSNQIKADSSNFSCNTIKKYRKDSGVHQKLNRGVALLEGDKELKQYIHDLANMHIAKLRSAFQLLITPVNFSHSNEKIEIFDWGCGQALGAVALIDQLKIYRNKNAQISKVTLIDPGADALRRASLHTCLALNSDLNINPINKFIDNSLDDLDLMNEKNSIKIHIFSNIIDVTEVDADLVIDLITTKMTGLNYMVCVGPRFGDWRDSKMEYFTYGFKNCNDFHVISNREDKSGWNHKKSWSRKEMIFKIIL